MPQTEPTLVVGASPNPSRYSFKATQMLLEHGHTVVPYGIKKGQIGSLNIHNKWPSNQAFDTVTLYMNPKLQQDYIQRILDLHPRRIIFNPGTENESLKLLAIQQNIIPTYACTLVLLRTNQY